VGYVYENAVSASQDAEKRYWGQKKVRVFGKRKFYSSREATDIQDSIMLEPRNNRKNPLNILAVYMLDGDSLVLSGEQPIHVDNNKILIKNIRKPDWIVRLPTEKGYVYGVGEGRLSRRTHHRSWSRTDENAIVSCAKAIRLEVGNLIRKTKKSEDSRVENVISEHVDVVLQDVQILGRWLDYDAMTCFSLARSKVD